MKSVNERLKIIRNEMNLNQEEFGKKLSLTKFAISNYENGKTNIPDRVVNDICREFDVHEDWLRTGEGEIFVQRTRNQIIADFLGGLIIEEDASFKKRLIEALAALDERDWKGLEKLATSLSNKTG